MQYYSWENMLEISNRVIRRATFKVKHKSNRTTGLTFWCHVTFSSFSMFFEANIEYGFALLLLFLKTIFCHRKVLAEKCS